MMNVMIILAGIGGLIVIVEKAIIIGNYVVERIKTVKYHNNISRKLNSLRYVKYDKRA
jgi:hypothetical protein